MNNRSAATMTGSLLTLLLLFALAPATSILAAPDFQVDRELKFKVKKEKEGYSLESKVKYSYTYLTKRSTNITQFSIYEPFYAKVSDIEGEYDGNWIDRNRITFNYAEHEDIFLANTKVWWIDVPAAKEGKKLTYQYEMEYEGANWFPVQYIENSGRMNRYVMTIEHPKDVTVSFDFFFPRDPIPYRVENPDNETTTLIIENIEEQKSIPFFPYNGLGAAVQTRLEANGVAITPTKIDEFTEWYRNLYDPTPMLDSAHSLQVAAMLKGVSDPHEKLRVIHDYVRSTIRYIAEENDYGAIVPRNPNLVLNRSYGDCKDRAYLVSTIARQNGLKVDMVLVATDPSPEFARGVYVGQFNHVICAWGEGKDRIYFDPTSKYTEFGNLPYSDIESTALVLDPEKPQLIRIPRPNSDVGIEVDINADIEDLKHGQATVTLRNSYASSARRAMNDLRGLDLENHLSNMVTSHFSKMSLDYFEPDTVGEDFIRFNAAADLSDFMIFSTEKRYIPAMPFSSIDADIMERTEDPYPVTTSLRETVVMRLNIDTKGLSVESKDLSVGDDQHATFSSSIAPTESGNALLTYRIWQSSGYFEGEQKAGFLDFCRDFLKSKKQMFVLRPAGN